MPTRRPLELDDAERAARSERLVKARAAHEDAAALRALEDPKRVKAATRVVGAALDRGVIDVADIVTATRRAQGLEPTITDPATLDDIATLLIGGGDDGPST